MKAGVAVMMKTLLDKNKDVIGVFYTAEEGSSEQNGLNFLMDILKKDFSIAVSYTHLRAHET